MAFDSGRNNKAQSYRQLDHPFLTGFIYQSISAILLHQALPPGVGDEVCEVIS